MLVNAKTILKKANKGHYAIGAFNTSNLEITKAIAKAAENLNAPIIIQTTPSAITYAGLNEISCIVRNIAKETKTSIALHLDHGDSIATVRKCLSHGYTSVMIDASSYTFKKNINITKKVVYLAHKRKVQVEAELGRIKGIEDAVKAKEHIYTNPDEAVEFVKKSGCDSLAIAIGTAHGAYKFKATPTLDFKRLKEIKQRLKIPLVLHGASGIPKEIVRLATTYGAKLKGSKGVPNSQIRKAVKLGINKVNIDSDLRISFDAAIRKELKQHPTIFDPRKILQPAMDLITKTVEKKIKILGSEGKA